MQSVMGLLQIGSFSWHRFHSNAGFQHERHREKKSVGGLERPSEKLDLRLCVCTPTLENSGGHARLHSVTEAQYSMSIASSVSQTISGGVRLTHVVTPM